MAAVRGPSQDQADTWNKAGKPELTLFLLRCPSRLNLESEHLTHPRVVGPAPDESPGWVGWHMRKTMLEDSVLGWVFTVRPHVLVVQQP